MTDTPYHGNDIYCDLIMPRKVEFKVVKETNNLIAFYHTRPFWKTHLVVTSKSHVASFLELSDELAKEFFELLKEIASEVTDTEGACRILTNLGDYQDSKHLHFHVSSGDPLR